MINQEARVGAKFLIFRTVYDSHYFVAFAIFFGLSNRKRADTTDIEVKAKERAETNIKLDNIGKDVTDIKYDISCYGKS